MAIKFNVTDAERDLIIKIAHRADKELFGNRQQYDQKVLDTVMDLSACIAQGVPLRLDELLEADKFNFAHDVYGIRRHINRKTGKLENCFLPRFYRREVEA